MIKLVLIVCSNNIDDSGYDLFYQVSKEWNFVQSLKLQNTRIFVGVTKEVNSLENVQSNLLITKSNLSAVEYLLQMANCDSAHQEAVHIFRAFLALASADHRSAVDFVLRSVNQISVIQDLSTVRN